GEAPGVAGAAVADGVTPDATDFAAPTIADMMLPKMLIAPLLCCGRYDENSDVDSACVISRRTANDELMPDEQHDPRADGGPDEPCTLMGGIPADGLAEKCCEEGTDDAEDGGQNEAGRIVRAGCEETRDDACDKADQDDPKIRHSQVSLSFRKLVTVAVR